MSLILDGTNGLSDVDGSAATPAIRGSDANTGIFFPGADRIGFAEGGVQVGEFDDSGNFLMNSGYGSAAVAYGCRAWCNFNGTGTVAIRASGNVSSITDNGTGDYTVNFTTAMPDANYAGLGTLADTNAGALIIEVRENLSRTKTTGAFPINTAAGGNDANRTLFDFNTIYVSIFR
jgi:hypothetical protein